MNKKDKEKDHSPLNDSDYIFSEQVGHLLRKAYQRHMIIFQENSSEFSLTAPQFIALCTIQSLGACSITDIVAATDVDNATMRGVIERLESKGHIKITKDPKDGRKVMISLSPAGQSILEKMIPFAKVISDETMSGLNSAERVALLFLLKKMNDS